MASAGRTGSLDEFRPPDGIGNIAPGGYRGIKAGPSNGPVGARDSASALGGFGDGSSGSMVTGMGEGRKRGLGIIAGILVARHLKTAEDLHDSRPSPRTESLLASAVRWVERIMRRIDGTFANSADDKRWPRA